MTSLLKYNTFGLSINAARLIKADSIELMVNIWRETQDRHEPLLILGDGSNVLFLEDFSGTVLLNCLKGINIRDEPDAWYLHVQSGENWHDLVKYTLNAGIHGLENLALIPGLAGSAPIQNIGAYGVELKNVCEYVDTLNLCTGKTDRIPATECGFGYRESIFNRRKQTSCIIIGLGLRLTKQWIPVLSYGDLAKLDRKDVTPLEVFKAVCTMRRSKLPDPRELGNAGSFFKNPLVGVEKAASLVEQYPGLPHYGQGGGRVKLAAGWLIDQCGLKGYRVGGAAVHERQALVLVNAGGASSHDVVAVARHVRNTVADKFGVWLEPEVRFIGATGEQDSTAVLSEILL